MQIPEKLILENYKKFGSIRKVSILLNINTYQVKKCLKKNNVELKNDRRTYEVNDNAFSKLNPEVEYWLGFIAADGCIKNKLLILGLSSIDVNHLEKFKKFLKTNYPIHYHSTNGSCALRISSSQIIKDLNSYLIFQKKSKSLVVAKELQNSRHFWRGVFDGDGCISFNTNKQHYLILVGNFNVTTSFKLFCSQYVNSNSSILPSNGSYRYQLSTAKCKTMLDVLYDDCDIFLDRKYKQYIDLKDNFQYLEYNKKM